MPFLHLLGGARIEGHEGVATGRASRRHPLSLLAVLATAESQRVSRGTLAGLLWPETREATARNRLSTVVHQIRGALGPAALISGAGDELKLTADGLECDVWHFRAALQAGLFEDAVEQYTGVFLDGFRPPASVELELRLDRQRARLRRAYHSALEGVARVAEHRGRRDEAADWWRQLVDDEPYDARLTIGLMRALVSAGDRAGALQAGARHTSLLAEELGASPDPEVESLSRQIRNPEATARGVGHDDPRLRGIAVLPFVAIGPEQRAQAVADGIHGDLIIELARSPAIPVIARASVLTYRDRVRASSTIARELGARYLVEGAVQQVEDRVRLRVRLVDAEQGTAIWAERYDRDRSAEALFDLQTHLVSKVSEAVRARVKAEPGEAPTQDLEAYRLNASGRALMDQRSHAALRRAEQFFKDAIHRDPHFPQPWAALSETIGLLISYEQLPPEQAGDAVDAARQALALRADLPEAYVALGFAHAARREGPAAITAFRRAIELRPSYASAHGALAFIVLPLGFEEDGLPHMERAARLDPSAPEYQWGLGFRHFIDGSPLDVALFHARRARELAPGYAEAALLEGQLLSASGRPGPALRILRLGLDQATVTTRSRHLAAMVGAQAAAGDCSRAEALIGELRHARQPFYLGMGLAALGRVDESIDEIRRDDWNPGHCAALRYDPAFAAIRAHRCYPELLRGIENRWGLIRETAASAALPT